MIILRDIFAELRSSKGNTNRTANSVASCDFTHRCQIKLIDRDRITVIIRINAAALIKFFTNNLDDGML